MEEANKTASKRTIFVTLIVGVLIGAALLMAGRIVLAKSHAVHYHANFGLFINGKRDMFDSFAYYEEVQACNAASQGNPKTRVHMHDHQYDTVHVHDEGVTWGNFFENLGYGLTDNAVITKDGTFVDGVNGDKLTFILNGHKVDTAANRVIKSEDTLLISYGNPVDATGQYAQIKHTAHEHNKTPDPATCSGSKTDLTFHDRLKQAFDFTR